MVVNCIRYSAPSTKQVVKAAEKVCRIISSEFPYVSTTKMGCFARTAEQEQLFKQMSKGITNVMRPKFNGIKDPLEYYKALVETIKKYKLANCQDHSELAGFLLGLNGIKVKSGKLMPAKLRAGKCSSIDHAVQLFVPSDTQLLRPLNKLNDAVVIDSWLGFSAPAKATAEKYTKEFSKFIGIDNPKDILVNTFRAENTPVTEKVVAYFREHYPQFFFQ